MDPSFSEVTRKDSLSRREREEEKLTSKTSRPCMMRIMQGREAPKPIYFFFFACSVISHKERSLRTRRGRKWSLARRLGRTRRTATREKEAQTKLFFPSSSFEELRLSHFPLSSSHCGLRKRQSGNAQSPPVSPREEQKTMLLLPCPSGHGKRRKRGLKELLNAL